MFRQFFAYLFIPIVLLASPCVYAVTHHALVVGVSRYPNLEAYLQLKGPENDVRAVTKLLYKHGFKKENILVLSESQGKSHLPTAKNIRKAFKTLLQRSRRGDIVYMHFSGHGSQQPVSRENLRNNEADGLDEIFLPRDVKNWDDTIGKVKNAIVDDEIGQIVMDLRKKGVFVWLVFDSCHAGTMAKGLALQDKDIRTRMVSPAQLGIPVKRIQNATLQAKKSLQFASKAILEKDNILDLPSDGHDRKLAGYMAFYASQPAESTIEMKLPGKGSSLQTIGLFTYTLSEIISSERTLNYQSLANKILERYSQGNTEFTPMFEGDSFKARLFEAQ